MRERIVTFGDCRQLVGILTEGSALRIENKDAEQRPALVLLNAGLLHRVGPFRLNVDLARACAEAGFLVLRFDLSGIGDSAGRREGLAGSAAIVADVRAAMDLLASTWNQRRFVLWGLCTGAINAHKTALADDRVCGVVCVDGFAYRTRRFLLHRYLPFLTNPIKLAGYLGWRLARVFARGEGRALDVEAPAGEESYGWDPPPQQTAERELAQLLAREVAMLYIYSGDSQTRLTYNHQGQFRDMFPGLDAGGRIEDVFMRDSDHIFTRCAARRGLIERTRAWLETRFPLTNPTKNG